MLLHARTSVLSLMSVLAPVMAFGMGGCSSRDGGERELLEGLEASPIFLTDGMSVVALGPRAARLKGADAEKQGIDLYGAYKRNLSKSQLRLSLAYLLLMQQSAAYLDYAIANRRELAEAGEFVLWAYVLEDAHSMLTEDSRMKILEVLEGVGAPYALFSVAKYHLVTGDEATAIREMLDLLVSRTAWDVRAYEELNKMPAARRSRLLLPYLDSESLRGVSAAALLARIPDERQQAIRYLESVKTSKDQALVVAAAKALREVARVEPPVE